MAMVHSEGRRNSYYTTYMSLMRVLAMIVSFLKERKRNNRPSEVEKAFLTQNRSFHFVFLTIIIIHYSSISRGGITSCLMFTASYSSSKSSKPSFLSSEMKFTESGSNPSTNALIEVSTAPKPTPMLLLSAASSSQDRSL